MNSRDWLYPMAIVACAFFAFLARYHANKAARSLEDAKATIAAWWRQAKPGMPIPHELQRRK